jgi:2-pyrone-4,6-dicarboxylate lactonase
MQGRFVAPEGSCDCHAHVFGDVQRYPPVARRLYDPPNATVEDLLRIHAALGIGRGVIVQPTVYGTDNRLLVDTLRGHSNFRGVAAINDALSEDELLQLHAAGVRGVRFSLAGTPDLDMYDRCIRRIAPLGWHVKWAGSGADLVRHAAWLDGLQVPMVIDHLGAPDASKGVGQPDFQCVLTLLARANCWILLANADRRSAVGFPWADMAPFVSAAVKVAPDRAIWASDWPHLLYARPDLPDEGDLLEFLHRAVGNDATVRKILVDNPARLYGFV